LSAMSASGPVRPRARPFPLFNSYGTGNSSVANQISLVATQFSSLAAYSAGYASYHPPTTPYNQVDSNWMVGGAAAAYNQSQNALKLTVSQGIYQQLQPGSESFNIPLRSVASSSMCLGRVVSHASEPLPRPPERRRISARAGRRWLVRAGWATARAQMREAIPVRVSVRRLILLPMLGRNLLVKSRRGWHGLIACALIALVMTSSHGAPQPAQDPVDRNVPQDAKAPGAPADDDKALHDFLQLYQLGARQDLKRIEPPRPPGAAVWWKRKFPINGEGGPEALGAMVFRWHDPDRLTNLDGLFLSADEGYSIRNLPQAIGIDVDPAEIEGDPELLKTAITGDWVAREGVPAERMVDSLESILQRSLRLRVKLTFRLVDRDVVVARGRFRYMPSPGRSRNEIDVYGKQLVKDAAVPSTGEFPTFLKRVGGFIGRPVLNEVEAPPREPISWFTHFRSPFTERMKREDHDETLVLQHVHEQTGLTFTREMKPIRILFIVRPRRA
jgi:hypothetical protein